MRGRWVSIGSHVQVSGKANIYIGDGSTIGDNTWLAASPNDEKIRMRIGRCVLVGRQSMLSTGGYMEIGDYCIFAPRVYISDADHVFSDPYQPIAQQGSTLGRSVIVEENCWLGINTVITGNITIGRGSVIAANTTVRKDIPPFSVVAGNPSKIFKMFNLETKIWERIFHDDDVQRIIKTNNEIGLPSREEYRLALTNNATISRIGPDAGGPTNKLFLVAYNTISRLFKD